MAGGEGQFSLELVGNGRGRPIGFEVRRLPGEEVGVRQAAISMAKAGADDALRERRAVVEEAGPDVPTLHAEEGVGVVEADLEPGNAARVGDLTGAQVALPEEEVLGGHSVTRVPSPSA